ncbi:MAG: hypothetical protein IKR11_12335 [Solobacterium sp.]|nr:hypothetical protein [Solobacterium sp.]
MKKLMTILLSAMMICMLASCKGEKPAETVSGGWTITDSLTVTEEAQNAFDKAMENLTGVNYTPLGLLGTQLVSGTNYCFICEASVVIPDPVPYYAVVSVYQNLQGEAQILNIVPLDIGDIAETGKINPKGQIPEQLAGGWYVDREAEVDAEDAQMHLASQVVSGLNHCVLCKGWKLVFVYEDLSGKTETTKTVNIDLGSLAQPTDE